MSAYCFDTDVLSSLARPGGGPPALARRLGVVAPEGQFTSAVTVGELRYGALKRGNRALEDDIEQIVGDVQVVPFDELAARAYAELRVRLEREGRPLGHPDLQIAAICLSHDLTLVTGNVRHFDRVPGLRVENWLE
ncbi:MAG: PIN domain-containing protein [Actinobacteria bacterium]|nr:PIN domain-containing protein [Actinomycetota bacterium]